VEDESHRWLHHGVVVSDKELDLIEMVVYGNVIRPCLQCKCKSVAETLGTAFYKSKGPEVSAYEMHIITYQFISFSNQKVGLKNSKINNNETTCFHSQFES
jgi:hypothetical protein